ncbi:PilZ domain-containing protein [Methylobacterium sp. 4-46]|uniref:PilZ domain-containing protein n=1 Tax=unclassified Methylobacterium TaxID=2615210 RepID=UPI0012F6EDA7
MPDLNSDAGLFGPEFGTISTVDSVGISLCGLREISPGGARLLVPPEAEFPDDLDLMFGPRPIRVRCSVVWRAPGQLGVAFLT